MIEEIMTWKNSTFHAISILLVIAFRTVFGQCPPGALINIRQLNGFSYNGSDHTTISTSNVTNMIECMSQCIHQMNCDAAIICGQTDGSKTCFNIKGNITTSPNPTFTGCQTVSKVKICNNGGNFIDGICHCTVGFTGYRCEVENDGFCHSREWTKIYSRNGSVVSGDSQLIKQAMENGSIRKVITGAQTRIISFASTGSNKEIIQVAERLKIDFENKSNMTAFRIVELVSPTDIYTWSFNLDTLKEETHSRNGDIDWFISSFSNEGSCVETKSSGAAATSGSMQSCWIPVNTSSSSIFISFKGEADSIYMMEGNNIYVTTPFGLSTSQQVLENPMKWVRRHFYASGNRELMTWYVKNHTLESASADFTSKSWYLDRCWQEVYQNSPTGNTINGNIDYLMAAVKNGKSVRVIVESRVSYLRDVSIRNLTISGVMHDTDNSSTPLQQRVLRERVRVATSGSKVTCRFLWESTLNQSYHASTGSVRWFVDTRSWSIIMSMTSSGVVLRGKKTDVIAILNEGKTAKIILHHIDNSLQALDVNHIHIFNSTFFVMDTGIQGSVDKQTGSCQQWSGYLYSNGVYEIVVFSTGSMTITPRTTVAYKSVDIFIQT